MCGWQVQLCDPLLHTGLSALEIRLCIIKRYTKSPSFTFYFLKVLTSVVADYTSVDYQMYLCSHFGVICFLIDSYLLYLVAFNASEVTICNYDLDYLMMKA